MIENQGASVVITHHIKNDKQPEYEAWLNEIGPICRNAPGNIDWQIIRPIPNLTYDYTVITRFDTISNLENWMNSPERKRLIQKAMPLFAKNDTYFIKSGLDFLFVPGICKSQPPVRWKQYLVTWSAIFPLSIIIPVIVLPLLRNLKLPANRFTDSFFITSFLFSDFETCNKFYCLLFFAKVFNTKVFCFTKESTFSEK